MSATDEAELALRLIVQEIGIGLVVGLLLTKLAASAIRYCWKRGWITDTWRQMIVVAVNFAGTGVAVGAGLTLGPERRPAIQFAGAMVRVIGRHLHSSHNNIRQLL